MCSPRQYRPLLAQEALTLRQAVDLPLHSNPLVDAADTRRPSTRNCGFFAFREQIRLAGPGPWLFPSDENPTGHQKTPKTVWHETLRRAKVSYFRIYDLRSTYASGLSAGGVADESVRQLLRQGDAKVFKKYSQMKLQMKREAPLKINRKANKSRTGFETTKVN